MQARHNSRARSSTKLGKTSVPGAGKVSSQVRSHPSKAVNQATSSFYPLLKLASGCHGNLNYQRPHLGLIVVSTDQFLARNVIFSVHLFPTPTGSIRRTKKRERKTHEPSSQLVIPCSCTATIQFNSMRCKMFAPVVDKADIKNNVSEEFVVCVLKDLDETKVTTLFSTNITYYATAQQ